MAVETKSALGLVEWYRSERRKQMGRGGSGLRLCQCSTETLISTCESPALMRAFLFLAFSIDQAMEMHSLVPARMKTPNPNREYDEFRRHFSFPKLEAHGMGEFDFVTPDWVIYDRYGWDKLMDWSLSALVAETLLGSTHEWIESRPSSSEVWARLCRNLRGLISTFDQDDPRAAARVAAALNSEPS